MAKNGNYWVLNIIPCLAAVGLQRMPMETALTVKSWGWESSSPGGLEELWAERQSLTSSFSPSEQLMQGVPRAGFGPCCQLTRLWPPGPANVAPSSPPLVLWPSPKEVTLSLPPGGVKIRLHLPFLAFLCFLGPPGATPRDAGTALPRLVPGLLPSSMPQGGR